MSFPTSKPFSFSHLTDLLSLVTTNALARWPRATYLMNSDVAWRLPASTPEENLRLWYDGNGIAGYVWFEPNSPISMDLRVDLSWNEPTGASMLRWLEDRRTNFGPLYPWLIDITSMEAWEHALSNA